MPRSSAQVTFCIALCASIIRTGRLFQRFSRLNPGQSHLFPRFVCLNLRIWWPFPKICLPQSSDLVAFSQDLSASIPDKATFSKDLSASIFGSGSLFPRFVCLNLRNWWPFPKICLPQSSDMVAFSQDLSASIFGSGGLFPRFVCLNPGQSHLFPRFVCLNPGQSHLFPRFVCPNLRIWWPFPKICLPQSSDLVAFSQDLSASIFGSGGLFPRFVCLIPCLLPLPLPPPPRQKPNNIGQDRQTSEDSKAFWRFSARSVYPTRLQMQKIP